MSPYILTSLLLAGTLFSPAQAFSQTPSIPETEYMRAKIIAIVSEEEKSSGGMPRLVQQMRVAIVSGSDDGKELLIENGILPGREDMRLSAGETVIVEKLQMIDGGTRYLIRDTYRLPALLWLTLLFLILGIVLGRKRGAMAIVGLFVSILVLTLFVVPRIIAGGNPLMISLIGAYVIAISSLLLAHGWNKRTFVALGSTLITLTISMLLALFFVSSARLFGMGSEESMFLQFGTLKHVNLRGLLLGGIIIGALGVLDDITTAQTAVIDELRRANPRMSFRELYLAGISIGREHIASLVNTLALAYVGASLPLLLLFTVDTSTPLWALLSSEFLAEEIVRTLVGSTTLLFAVPIATWLAVWAFHGRSDTTLPAYSSRVRHSH